MKKEIGNQLLLAIRESSIDCTLHTKPNDPNPPRCMTFGSRDSSSFIYEPEMTIEANADTESKRNLKKITWKGQVVKLTNKFGKKIPFIFKADRKGSKTGEIYDFRSYIAAQKGEIANPTLWGRMVLNKNGKPIAVPEKLPGES